MSVACRVALLATALVGCADRGVFEIEIVLPAQETVMGRTGRQVDLRFAAVQLRPGRTDPSLFDAPWINEQTTEVVALDPGATRRMRIDVTVSGGAADDGASMKLIFCNETSCGRDGAPPDRSEWFVFERVGYVGAVTSYEIDRGAGSRESDRADGPTVVGRCQIRGCNQGVEAPTYCVGGAHLCDGS